MAASTAGDGWPGGLIVLGGRVIRTRFLRGAVLGSVVEIATIEDINRTGGGNSCETPIGEANSGAAGDRSDALTFGGGASVGAIVECPSAGALVSDSGPSTMTGGGTGISARAGSTDATAISGR